MNANTTTELNEMARNQDGSVNPDGLRRVQELAFGAIGESGRRAFFEFKGRQSCIKAAQAKPLPGASANAIIKGATKVAEEVVREVLPIHIACLQAVDSPLLKLVNNAIESAEKKSNVDFSESAQWELCYIFTQEPRALRTLLKEEGVSALQSKSEAKCSEWNAAKCNTVILAIIEQFHRHVQTTVRFSNEVEGQVDARFFQALQGQLPKPADKAG